MLYYKKPLLVYEQTKYLHDNKRIVYNVINEENAQTILEKYNYINVISPFKYNFARKNADGTVVKVNNKHIYDRDVDFNEYYELYSNERSLYPTIFANISQFETIFNAIVSYHAITKYNIDNSDKFDIFINSLKLNLINKIIKNLQKTILLKI